MSPRKALRQGGFTLIELILVITILGVISVSVASDLLKCANLYNGRRAYSPCFRCAVYYTAPRKRAA